MATRRAALRQADSVLADVALHVVQERYVLLVGVMAVAEEAVEDSEGLVAGLQGVVAPLVVKTSGKRIFSAVKF